MVLCHYLSQKALYKNSVSNKVIYPILHKLSYIVLNIRLARVCSREIDHFCEPLLLKAPRTRAKRFGGGVAPTPGEFELSVGTGNSPAKILSARPRRLEKERFAKVVDFTTAYSAQSDIQCTIR